jgi:hypothetical protein
MSNNLTPLALAALLAAGSAQAVDLGPAGYAQNFDGLGTAGTAPPAGWTLWVGPSGTSNTTWQASIPASGVAALVPTSGPLAATSNPTATRNNGYNAAFDTSTTADRLLATSPTSVSGAAIQLSLTNQTGASFSQLQLSYDTRRYGAASTANELPGYWLFYSLDGGTWSSALNPTLATVPNSAGVSTVANALVTLAAPVAAGQNFLLRWVDDNAVQTSPDQIIGLNNVAIAAVPEPGTVPLLLAGLAFVGCWLRPRVAARRRDAESQAHAF